MKTLISLILVVSAASGCATLGSSPDYSGSTSSIVGAAASSSPAPAPVFPPQQESIGPRLIIPVTGGPPVIGIPVGGDLFLPVTGGPPVIGIPTGP
jgi:hypothetical protein